MKRFRVWCPFKEAGLSAEYVYAETLKEAKTAYARKHHVSVLDVRAKPEQK